MELPQELEDAIVAAPNDREGYSVASDWLQQVGGPQGELVALSLAESDNEIIDRMIELKHQLLPPEVRTLNPMAVEWRWGFIRGFQYNTIDDPSEPRMIRDLLASPIARFLQKLVLEQANARIVDAIFEAASAEPRALRCMRTLIVRRQGTHPIDLGVLSRALPALRRLQFWSTATRGRLAMNDLLELQLQGKSYASAICETAELPSLEYLAVSGDDDVDWNNPNHWLIPASMPALRYVSLGVRQEIDRRIWDNATICKQLEQLDVFNFVPGTPSERLFVIDRRPSSPTAALLVMASNGEIKPGILVPIVPELFRIGRDKTNHLRLDDSYVGKQQAELGQIGAHWHIQRCDEKHHCYVNGRAIDNVSLRAGDELTLGSFVLRLLEGTDIEQQAAKVRALYAL